MRHGQSTDMVRWSLAWRNPNTQPPGPKVLKAMIVPRGTPCPHEVMELWVAGNGYCIGWELVTQRPIVRWSKEAKAGVRRRIVAARRERKFPLFASMFEDEELGRRPGYYDGDDAQKVGAI